MYVFASVAICVAAVALAVGVAVFSKRCAALRITTILSCVLFAAGLVTVIASNRLFFSREAQNDWAVGAFENFFGPMCFVTLFAVAILSAGIVTAKGTVKGIICLTAAALFSFAAVSYTALFSVLAETPSSSVFAYIRACGVGFASCFAAVPASHGIKRLIQGKK